MTSSLIDTPEYTNLLCHGETNVKFLYPLKTHIKFSSVSVWGKDTVPIPCQKATSAFYKKSAT